MISAKRFHTLSLPLVLGLVMMGACGSDDALDTGTASQDTAPEETVAESAVEEPSAAAVPFTDGELVAVCLEEPASEAPAPAEPGILADADGLRYCVGPALQVGIESATAVAAAVDATFGPSIEPVLTEAGIDAFNLLAAECFDPTIGDSSCPSGQIAIVTDGRILSAPTINAPAFARDQLVILGDFTTEEAGVIAEALVAEQLLTIRPVLLALGPEGP